MQAHMASVQACVSQLIPFIEAVIAGDWAQADIEQQKIVDLENEADNIKNEIRLNLPNSLLMAISRRDVIEVLHMQDLIANKAKDISGLMRGRKMQIPSSFAQEYLDFLKRCVAATLQAKAVINELDELVATGFQGPEVQRVEAMITKLQEIETATDQDQVKLRASCFEIEKDLPPVDVIFLYQIINWTGELADAAQSAGDRLQLMLAK